MCIRDRIRSENELWIGLVLVSGYLDDLDPPELAAIIQAVCVDIRRPNLWCNFKPSIKVIDVFNELDGLRKLVAVEPKLPLSNHTVEFLNHFV